MTKISHGSGLNSDNSKSRSLTPDSILDAWSAKNVPFDVEKVVTLEVIQEQPYKCSYWVDAHIAYPMNWRGTLEDMPYALLAVAPRHGVAYLGEIEPKTREFKSFGRSPSIYERDKNGVIYYMNVPPEYLSRLKTIDDICNIPDVTVKDERIPLWRMRGSQ